MITVSSHHPFGFAFRYKYRLRDNALVDAPQLIIKDLKRLYLYHLKRLTRKSPDMIRLPGVLEDCEILRYNPEDFPHPDCDECARHWRYIRGCLRNRFRCMNVKQDYEQWKVDVTNRIRESVKNINNVIEVVRKGYSYFMVPYNKESVDLI